MSIVLIPFLLVSKWFDYCLIMKLMNLPLHVLVCVTKHVDVTKEHAEINKVISMKAVCHTISLYFGTAKHFFPC